MIVFPRIRVEGVRNSENLLSLLDRSDRFSSDKCRWDPKFGKSLKLIVMIVSPRISVEGVRNSEFLIRNSKLYFCY